MRRVPLAVVTLSLLWSCGERTQDPALPSPRPLIAAPQPTAAPMPQEEGADPAAPPTSPAVPTPSAEEAPEPPSPAVRTPRAERDESPQPRGPLRPDATVEAEPDEQLRFGVVYRLAHAIGLPGVHIHGRPTPAGERRHVVVVSFAGDTSAWDEMASLRPAVWLVQQDADGTTRRVAEALVPHTPVESHHAVAVGEAPAGDGFTVHTARVGDLDNDGQPEFEMVIDVDDEVVCGAGLLTHRFFMVYNLGAEMAVAADIPLSESTHRGPATRGTVRWVDHNEDGHPDLDLRLKECNEGGYGDDTCQRESTSHRFYHWDSETDRWNLGGGGSVPCGE